MNATLAVTPLEPSLGRSPLATARLARRLTLEEAAKKARLSSEEVTWLEEGRLYRFHSGEAALLAALLYSTALGVDRREACKLAGLRVAPRPLDSNPGRRLGSVAALLLLVAALAALVTVPGVVRASGPSAPTAPATLPAPWKVSVDVLNGNGDIAYTRRVATRVGALAYQVSGVRRANRFDYPETAVYHHPGGEHVAARLAKELGVPTKPLPGAGEANHLVVIVGPARAIDQN